jgi:uncharacterized protein (TIGR02996 family)
MTPADPTLAALLRAVLDRPADDVPRLVLADWWDERGEPDRAEFVRVQAELAKMGDDGGPVAHDIDGRCGCELCALRRRERDLLLVLAESLQPAPGWCVVTPAGYAAPDWPAWAVARRGFVDEVTCAAAAWLAHGDEVCASHPVSKVTLTDHPGRADEKLVGGPPPGAALYSVAGKLVECPRCEGDPAVLFPLRWPGVAFELPPEPPPLTVERIVRGSSPEDVLRPVRELMGRVNDREVMGQPRGSLLHERSECRAVADGVDNYWRVTHTFRLLPPDSTPVRFGAYEFADFAPLFGGNPPAG